MNKEKNTKKLIEDILINMGVRYDIVEETEDTITQKKLFIIKSPESGLLIGDRGETFQALSHLIRRIASKDLEEMADFSIDVNDYRASMIERLKVKAGMLANRARDMKTDVELEPMSSYERLIIHGTLSGQPNIKTESIGEGKERRLVIKYVK
ncbi:MAG: R3H domain-containing nucleic acid-binding protein [Candidatus Paceibacterota bacterium]|jgi:spoIIIJ-associated protein